MECVNQTGHNEDKDINEQEETVDKIILYKWKKLQYWKV